MIDQAALKMFSDPNSSMLAKFDEGTQHELGKRADLAEMSVTRLECGMRNDPPLSTLKKLAKALKVPITELLD